MSKVKRSLSVNILTIGIFTLLAVGSWVSFDVYRAVVKTTIPKVLQAQIEPLDAEIDPQLVSKLRQRRRFDDNYLNTLQPRFLLDEDGEVQQEISIQPDPITETATSSGELTTQEASPSATGQ